MRRGEGRGRALAIVVVLVASAAGVGLAGQGTAAAAGPGQYGDPVWLPLRHSPSGDSILQGCTFQSPAPACWLRGTNHHPYWALDLLAPKGTPVYAAGAGQVVQMRKGEPGCSATANFVDIDHDPGYAGVWTDYWHLDEVYVEIGDWVDENTVIGTVGDTGMPGTPPDSKGECGPHLHYEKLLDIWPNRVDPGPLQACHGGDLVVYPLIWGLSSWAHIPWGSYRVSSDGTQCSGGPFYDVPANHPFVDAITWMVDEGIGEGYPDGRFHPTTPATRQATAAFLHRLAGSGDDLACQAAPFTDVDVDDPFCGEIAWALAAGLVSGYPDGSFQPQGTVSRQALMAMLHRLDGEPLGQEPLCSTDAFSDVPASHPFCGEVAWAVGEGIATGYGDGSFGPGGAVSRQAVAAFLSRFAV
jgi:hypothetical protein